MKVLLVAAGRRVSLAQRFKQHGFSVFSYETEKRCPIATVAEVIEGKSWEDKNIRQHLVETIDRIEPDLVLSLADKGTPILSSISHKGIVAASGQTNTICLDKRKFEEFLKDRWFYPNVSAGYPVIIKPIFGANSKGLIKNISFNDYITNKSEYDRTHIGQRQIGGEVEISVDAFFNRFSRFIDAVPRRRIEVQGGEVSRSITLRREAYGVVEITKQIGEQIGLVGPVCAQYIIENDKPYILEINARFGGGVILSLEAGFDQVQLLKEERVLNKELAPKEYDWKPNFGMTRYFQEYFYETGE
jgi:carbamoyl-phosphate synthase large subunit